MEDGRAKGRKAFARRKALFLAGVAGVVVVGVAVVVLLLDNKNTGPFNGTVLEPPMDASAFSLQDQRGETYRLADARGKVVVLTFLYTSCTDVCPFIAVKLRSALEMLGDNTAKVEVVAISTDPNRDTVQRASDYTRELGLNVYRQWHFLVGSEDELQPIWDAYFIGQPTITDDPVWATEKELEFYGLLRGLKDRVIQDANRTRGEFGGGYDVGHGTPVWLIDKHGQMHVKLGQDLGPQELVQDIRRLLDR